MITRSRVHENVLGLLSVHKPSGMQHEDWLSGRKQVVLVGQVSGWSEVLSGVPQCSVYCWVPFCLHYLLVTLIILLIVKFADNYYCYYYYYYSTTTTTFV